MLTVFEIVPDTVALVKLSVNLTSSILKPLICAFAGREIAVLGILGDHIVGLPEISLDVILQELGDARAQGLIRFVGRSLLLTERDQGQQNNGRNASWLFACSFDS